MTNAKLTKRALVSSIISLVLCVSMFVGTTFAWFTDSVTSANNIIKSGNLDIALEYYNGTDWVSIEEKEDILTNTLWEPGTTEIAYLRVRNAGSLALKYQLGVQINDETPGVNVAGEEFKLSTYLYYDVIDLKNATETEFAYADRDAAIGAVESADKLSVPFAKSGTLEAKSPAVYFALVVYMPTTVGNEANHNGTDIPKIDLGINIVATQMTSEQDSFDNQYDNGAFIPVAPEAVPEAGKNLVLKGSDESKVQVAVPATVIAGLDNEVTSLAIEASAPIVDTTAKTVTFTTIELVDQNGEEVDLSAANAKVTVTLPVGDAFANGETVEIYHDGKFVTYATVANGNISYEVSHFCEVTVQAKEEVVLDNVIDSVKEFVAFAEAVNAGKTYAGETVTLGADLDLAGVTWTPIGTSAHPFQGTFDGNGKVIKNLSVLMAGKSNVGLFGFTTNGEIKNVTVENAKVAGRTCVGVVAGTPYTTKYTNITVKGLVEVDGMAYVGAVGGKNAYANWDKITVNVDATSYVNANSVENGTAYRTYVGGVIGFMGEGSHTVSNVTSNIAVIGSTCDIGGIVGIAHYGNNFVNIKHTGTVTAAEDAFEVGAIAGVWNNGGEPVTLTNCTTTSALPITGGAYDTTGNGTLVIDGVVYVGSAGAMKAQLANGATDINLAGDINIGENITIANGKTVTLNLNGYAINATMNGTGNQELFTVKGVLNVNNGTITLTAGQNQGWSAMTTIFDITAGGVVNMESVVAENLGGTDMNFVAHLNNWGTATLNVEDSTLEATYVAVRVFNSGYDMNTVSIKNSTVASTGNAAFWVHNYTVADFGTQEKADAQAKLLNFNFEGTEFSANKAAFRYGFTNAEYYTVDGEAVVSNGDELKAALKAGKDVVFANDITMEATETNAYGKTGINVLNGQTIDGKGFALKVTNAGGTWDSAISTTGGTIKNLKVTGGFRGIFINHNSTHVETVVLENVTVHGPTYTISADQAVNQNLVATNCTFNGWTSYAKTLGNATFTNCNFGEGAGYAFCRPYAPTTFVGCTFAEGYAVDTSKTSGIVFENCTGLDD